MTDSPESLIPCPHCGEQHPAQAKFCPNTRGELFPQAQQCPQCGSTEIQGKEQCPNCGSWLGTALLESPDSDRESKPTLVEPEELQRKQEKPRLQPDAAPEQPEKSQASLEEDRVEPLPSKRPPWLRPGMGWILVVIFGAAIVAGILLRGYLLKPKGTESDPEAQITLSGTGSGTGDTLYSPTTAESETAAGVSQGGAAATDVGAVMETSAAKPASSLQAAPVLQVTQDPILSPSPTGTVDTPGALPEAPSMPLTAAATSARPQTDEPQGKIVFACQVFRDDHRDQICLMNADGSGWQRMTQNDSADYNYPVFSPDGQSILYTARESGAFQIFEMDLDGGSQQITSGAGGSYAPHVSPDGRRIVYTHEVGDIQSVWVMNRDGSNPHQVYGPPNGNGWDPVWSPGGDRILFASLRGDEIQLYSIRPNGSDLQKLTSLDGLRGRSDYSPDGSTVATYLGSSWQREIILMDADGSNLRYVTSGGNNLAPNFSPDGNWIVFTSYRDRYRNDNGCEIYVMRLDGSDIRRMTNNDYCDWQPNWGP